MKLVWLAGFSALVACGGKRADQDTVPTDTTSHAQGAIIDARTANEGDHIVGLRVATKRIEAAPGSRLGVTGSLTFAGEIQLTGDYRAHFDYPEVKVACFWVNPGEWHKLPRAKGDERIKWFCFENQDAAIEQLGELGTEAHATIVIDDYTTNLEESDVWDSARLVRVIEKDKQP